MSTCRIHSLSKSFRIGERKLPVLREIDLELEGGSFVSIVGYSGCGKSTFLKTVFGLIPPDEGRVCFEGMEGRRAIVFQEARLIRSKSVEQNLLLALHHRPDRRERETLVASVLSVLGLSAFRKAYPQQLSGGMAQRIALGRALCRQPELLLMDEPFGALDALNRQRLQQELLRIYQKQNMTILFVSHDVTEAVSLSQRVLVMNHGNFVQDIPVDLPYPRDPGDPEVLAIQDKVHRCIVSNNTYRRRTV